MKGTVPFHVMLHVIGYKFIKISQKPAASITYFEAVAFRVL